jgi:hypothetical protein
MDEEQVLVEAWKITIAEQAHFNDMTMKLRSFALTLVAAILTAESLANAGSLAVWAALISWGAFYLLDRWYYFYLLLGTVMHGEALEKRACELGMVLPMAPGSGNSLLGLTHRVSTVNQEGWKLRGKYKIDTYYFLIAVAIALILYLRMTKGGIGHA